jgi:2-methylisocitrate lyase-like PEP mutase family enzyme
MSADPPSGLGERLAAPAIVVAPGVYDAFGAMLAEHAGFGNALNTQRAVRVLERGRGYEEP